jgi:glycosyltransferase involved in cell wall biosynthesis
MINIENNKKCRVAFLDQSFIFSGAESSLSCLLEHLDTDRFILSLWFVFPMDHQKRYRLPHVEMHYIESSKKWWMGSDYWINPMRGTDFIKRIILGFKLASRLRKDEINILHINLAKQDSFWWAFWANLFGVKVVLHCRSDPMSWIPNRMTQNYSSAIIAVSDFIRNKVLTKNKVAPATTIYNPIVFSKKVSNLSKREEALSELGFSHGTMLLASVGLLSPHKGHDMAIRIFRNIRQKYPTAKLFIAGGGTTEELSQLKSCVSKLCVDQDVIFSAGQIENITTVYQAAYLILSLTTRGEAFGRVPFEATAIGTPVIAPSLGGAAEIIEDGKTGFLVDPLDEAAATDKTIQILDHYDWACRVTDNGRNRFSDLLSPQNSARAVMMVYQDILCDLDVLSK